MEKFYKKQVECPVCNKKFEAYHLRKKRLNFLGRDSDFCPKYEKHNPIFYMSYTCNHCGYTNFKKEFNKIDLNQIEKYKKTILPRWKKRKLNLVRDKEIALKVYKLQLLTYKVMNFKKMDFSKVFIKMTWIYRLLENYKQEKIHMKKAIDYFEKGYLTENLKMDNKKRLQLFFIIGEFNRKLGNYKKSIDWFVKIREDKSIKKHTFLERKTKDQWSLAADKFRELKNV
ncbi:MAG: DUF2225 domain-containing protein [Bacillota bacterium]